MTSFAINLKSFINILSFLVPLASRDSSRTNLNAIFLRIDSNNKKITCASTDGMILGTATTSIDCGDFNGDFLVDIEFANQLLNIVKDQEKQCRKINAEIKINFELTDIANNRYSIKISRTRSDVSLSYTTLNKKYPDYEKIIPTTEAQVSTITFNSDYLEKAFKCLGKNSPMKITFTGENMPAVITSVIGNNDNTVERKIVLMPMRF